MTLGVDVGGTFTDLAHWDGSSLTIRKVLTTTRQARGVLEGARMLLAGKKADRFLHGTTVATNAVLEGSGATVALITSAGLEDVLEIGRQDRPSLYDPMIDRPDPLVGRDLRFAVQTPDRDGGLPLDELAAALREKTPEAVAISLLYGYTMRDEERAIRAATETALPGVPVSLSADTSPEFREYERTSTTVLNAYLSPLMAGYLDELTQGVAALAPGVMVMRSSGGLIDAQAARSLPAAVLLSGPAGGAVAAAAVGGAHGITSLISFDMGGTSTDVCRIEHGRPQLSYERAVGGHPCRLPSVAIHTVGAGGGSIAWVDAGGALRVGPRSAGSRPGPASYGGGGTSATVTDAHVLLGRIGSVTRLGGEVTVDVGAAATAIDSIAEATALAPHEASGGVIEVADTRMERAIRHVSIEEGADPRGAWLVAFGGAGGLHATSLAKRFEMQGVIVPAHAGVLSAVGLLLSPLRADAARSLDDPRAGMSVVHDAADELIRSVVTMLVGMGGVQDETRRIAEIRYVGQSHETAVPLAEEDQWDDLAVRFHAEHQRRNGFSRPSDPIEVVTVRAEALSKPALTWDALTWVPETGASATGSRTVVGRDGRAAEAAVHWRPRLRPGDELVGPTVIEEQDATTYLERGDRARVLDDGSIEVQW